MASSLLARALELASDGNDLAGIRIRLLREGYANAHLHLSGRDIRKRICEARRTSRNDA